MASSPPASQLKFQEALSAGRFPQRQPHPPLMSPGMLRDTNVPNSWLCVFAVAAFCAHRL
jgi:hypothetical protein